MEKRLQQSRAYLEDPQASVREETVRFIGEATSLPRRPPQEAPRPPLGLPGPEADGRLCS